MPSKINIKYISLVAEEAAEVIHMCMKIQRWGLDSYHPDDPNKTPNWVRLASEVGDFLEVLDRLNLPEGFIETGKINKRIMLQRYGPK